MGRGAAVAGGADALNAEPDHPRSRCGLQNPHILCLCSNGIRVRLSWIRSAAAAATARGRTPEEDGIGGGGVISGRCNRERWRGASSDSETAPIGLDPSATQAIRGRRCPPGHQERRPQDHNAADERGGPHPRERRQPPPEIQALLEANAGLVLRRPLFM